MECHFLSLRVVFALAVTVWYVPVSSSIVTLRAVGPEGQGNIAAVKAWRKLVQAEVAMLPEILTAMDGANPLAANWLRSAVDTIAAREKKLPVAALKKFLADKNQNPRARRLAFELIKGADPDTAAKLISTMLNDPSVELRRDAVQSIIDRSTNLMAVKKDVQARQQLRQALDAARDVDQIQDITTRLRKLNVEVDLPHHFGFLMHWHVIGPFDNTGRGGFSRVFPPENSVDLDATHAGKDAKVRWIKFVTTDEYGKVNINLAYPGLIKEVTAYAYATYESPEAREVQLRLACKNAWKIWVNGKLVFGHEEYHRGTRIDHYQLTSQFKKGTNAILVKLCQNEETENWTTEWEFQMRVCDATGTALLAVHRPPTPTEGTNN